MERLSEEEQERIRNNASKRDQHFTQVSVSPGQQPCHLIRLLDEIARDGGVLAFIVS